ncbi:hypothetical protein JMM61_21525, partial [Rhodovulum sulfidophilum]|uniref:hypothetical protein n=1 Tax=Rhodovulum sulfidophilum TaxID=35806 RepID=UPI001929571C
MTGSKCECGGLMVLVRRHPFSGIWREETEMRLSGDIAADATDIVIEAAREADLSDRFGNTDTRYLCIGSEIIGYT